MSSLFRSRPLRFLMIRRSSFSVSAITLSMSTPIIIQTSDTPAPGRDDQDARYHNQRPAKDGHRPRELAKEQECKDYGEQGLKVAEHPGLLCRDLPYPVHVKRERRRGMKEAHHGEDKRLRKRQ